MTQSNIIQTFWCHFHGTHDHHIVRLLCKWIYWIWTLRNTNQSNDRTKIKPLQNELVPTCTICDTWHNIIWIPDSRAPTELWPPIMKTMFMWDIIISMRASGVYHKNFTQAANIFETLIRTELLILRTLICHQ